MPDGVWVEIRAQQQGGEDDFGVGEVGGCFLCYINESCSYSLLLGSHVVGAGVDDNMAGGTQLSFTQELQGLLCVWAPYFHDVSSREQFLFINKCAIRVH